jgi:hypothetical protein
MEIYLVKWELDGEGESQNLLSQEGGHEGWQEVITRKQGGQ